MKKGRGLNRALAPLSGSDLESLPTKALLARLKRLRWCEENPQSTDLTEDEIASAAGLILFKSDERWRQAVEDVKAILARREHVVR